MLVGMPTAPGWSAYAGCRKSSAFGRGLSAVAPDGSLQRGIPLSYSCSSARVRQGNTLLLCRALQHGASWPAFQAPTPLLKQLVRLAMSRVLRPAPADLCACVHPVRPFLCSGVHSPGRENRSLQRAFVTVGQQPGGLSTLMNASAKSAGR